MPVDELRMVQQVAKTSRALTRHLDKELGALHGLGFFDLELLIELHRAQPHRLQLGDLASRLDISASALVRLLVPLERIGVVKRWSEADHPRESEVELTEAGVGLVAHALLTASEVSVDALEEHCSPAEREALETLVRASLDIH